MRCTAVEAHPQRLREGRSEDDLARRSRLVVDVAELGVEPVVVERKCTDQAVLFLRGEDELDPGVRQALGEHAAHAFEHLHDGGLVVGAEDGAARVPNDAVGDHRPKRARRRHGVEVCAEEEGRSGGRRREPGVDVPHRRADLGAGSVLVGLESEVAQIAEDRVRDGTLLAGRARDGGELEEQLERCALAGHAG